MTLLTQLQRVSDMVQIINDVVVIVLLILVIFHLHSIDEHLRWIRRAR